MIRPSSDGPRTKRSPWPAPGHDASALRATTVDDRYALDRPEGGPDGTDALRRLDRGSAFLFATAGGAEEVPDHACCLPARVEGPLGVLHAARSTPHGPGVVAVCPVWW